MKKRQRIIIVLVALFSVIGLIILGNDFYQLKSDIEIDQVMSLLIIYGVIALVIERFCTKLGLPQKKADAEEAKKKLVVLNAVRTVGDDMDIMKEKAIHKAAIQDFQDSFSWMSFAISVMVSSFGFRFFSNIFQMSSGGDGVNLIIDIFLSAVLLAGGAQFILSLIEFLKPDKTT